MVRLNPISGTFELEIDYSIFFEEKFTELPRPKDLTNQGLANWVLDIWEHPEKYRSVRITKSSEFLNEMEEEGCIYEVSSFTAKENPYMVELKKRLD